VPTFSFASFNTVAPSTLKTRNTNRPNF